MRLYLSVLVLTLLQFGQVAGAGGTVSLATLRVHRDYGTFLVEVSDTEAVATGPKIRIECVEKCRHSISFEENPGDGIMGIFMPSDKQDLIFTIWGTGSALVVRAYKIGPASVSKVFEQYTKWYPYFIGSSAPEFIVRTFLFDERADSTRDQPRIYDWRWDGVAFNKIPAKPANLLPPDSR